MFNFKYKKFLKYKLDGKIIYCCAPIHNDEISRDRVEKYFEFIERDLDQNDFYEDYKTKIFSCNYVDVKMKIRNQANVIAVGGMCNCKNNMFRHVIVVSVILGLTEYPPESRNVPLEQKRKTGRPKENTYRFIRQPFEAYNNNPVFSSSDTSTS